MSTNPIEDLETQAAHLEDLVSQLRDHARDLRDQEKKLGRLWPTELEGPIINDYLPEARSLSSQLRETHARVDRLVRDLEELVAFADRISGDVSDT